MLRYCVRAKILAVPILVGWCLWGTTGTGLATETGAHGVSAQHNDRLPAEPDEFDRREVDSFYDWRNDLFFRVFKMAGLEEPANFMTARRTYKALMNREGYEVAITFTYPLFYWLDRNRNGEFEPDQDEMWIDIEEDGINGNERLYDPKVKDDSPQGPVPVPPIPSLRP